MSIAGSRFSTVPLQKVADSLTQNSPPPLDALLQKLQLIDGEIEADFSALKSDLTRTKRQLAQETARREKLTQERAAQDGLTKSLKLQVLRNKAEKQNAFHKRPSSPVSRKRNAIPPPFVCTCKENRSSNLPVDTGDHLPTCELKRAVLRDMAPDALCELLEAREEAYRVQQSLVNRLKGDNKELKYTYDKLWERYEVIHRKKVLKKNMSSVDERIEHLSFRVQQAGQAVCNVASQVEKKLQLTAEDVRTFRESFRQAPDLRQFDEVAGLGLCLQARIADESHGRRGDSARLTTMHSTREYSVRSCTSNFEEVGEARKENDLFNEAGVELMQTLALQKEAHDRLRTTVLELTQELERIKPEKLEGMKKSQEQLEAAEIHLDKVKAELNQKNLEIEDLKKQLKKVIAEYEAVSIAHSYSNAELSKIRATNRAKTKHDRHVKDGTENVHHHHHRKNYFR